MESDIIRLPNAVQSRDKLLRLRRLWERRRRISICLWPRELATWQCADCLRDL